MRKKQILCAILAATVLVGNGATVHAESIQPQSSKDAATYQEVEPNDDRMDATVIPMNQQCMGILETGKGERDVDWYKVTKTENGYIQLKFDIDISKWHDRIGNGWDIYVYDSQFREIDKYRVVRNSFTGKALPYKKGDYYIKVTQNSYDVEVPYGITVAQVKSDSWEQEGNDTQTTANVINLNKQYSGYIEDDVAKDWYEINLKKDAVVKFSLARGNNLTVEQVQSIGTGWQMVVYRASSGSIVEEVKNITERKDCTVELKKGKYYIRVSANDVYYAWTPTDIPYKLKVSNADIPGKTKIQKATGSKKTVTIKWKRVAGASGYYVYRSNSKNGAYRRVATLKGAAKTTYKNQKLKSGKTYYYKVAAYRKANGVTAVAKQCTAKAVKAK